MKTKTIITNVALALTLGVLYTGCEKAKDTILDTDTSSATDNSTADGAFSGIFKSVSEAADTSSGLKAGPCQTITVNTTSSWPRTLTIDFGTTGGCHGKKGVITAVLSRPWREAGSIITVTTQNFYDGLNKIDVGTHVITNTTVSGGNPSFSVDVTGASVITPAGTISWSVNRTIVWTAGSSTLLDQTDDEFEISGNASGTSVKGVTFTASITSPLKIAQACSYIKGGVITLTPKDKKARVIDFGNGTCDNKATVTIDGKTFDITM